MSFPCCWPPSDTPPAAPLRVNAGPDASVPVGDPLTLAGSASGGTPSYVYRWDQVSGPGTATFVDDTDPTTDVSFDVEGEYVLRLAAEDSLGQVAADQVTETVTAAPSFVLDDLSVQPLFAGSVAAQLRTGATVAFRVRRTSDDTEQDIGFVDGFADLDALSTFCGGGNGFVSKLYNQSLGGGPASLDETDAASQVYCYAEGSPVLGDNGLLTCRRDLPPAGNGYVGDLTLAGDVAASLIVDFAPQSASLPDFPYYAAGMVSGDGSGFDNAQWFTDSANLPSVSPYIQLDSDDSAAAIWEDIAINGWPDSPGWATFARSAGDDLASSLYQWNGLTRSLPQGTGGAFVPTFAIDTLVWVSGGWGSQFCLASFIFAFDVDLSTLPADLAALNTWADANHT